MSFQLNPLKPLDDADRQEMEERQREVRRQELLKERVCIVGFILVGLGAGIVLRYFWHIQFLR